MHPHDSHLHTVAGAFGSLTGGLYGAATESPWLALVGVLGSVLMPLVIEWMRGRRDVRIAKLKAENERLNERMKEVGTNAGHGGEAP